MKKVYRIFVKECIAIRAGIMRVTAELWTDNHLVGKVAIPVDTEKHTDTEGKFDVQSFQQHITNEFATLQATSSLSMQVTGLNWNVETDEVVNDSKEHTDQSESNNEQV